MWRKQLQAATQSPLRDKLLAVDIAGVELAQLARHIAEWTYWLLGTDRLFRTGSVASPSCPKDGALGEVCRILVAAKEEDRIALLASAVRWDDVVQGISMVEAIRKKGAVDVEVLIDLLVQFGDRIAEFGVTPGLDIATWKARIATLVGQKQAIPNLLAVLQMGCSGSGSGVEITPRLRTRASKAVTELTKTTVVLEIPEVQAWLTAASGAVGTTIAGPGVSVCETRELIQRMDLAGLEAAVFYLESFVSNYGSDVAKLSASRVPQLVLLLEDVVTNVSKAETLVGKLPVPGDLASEFTAVRDDLGEARRVVERLSTFLALVQSATEAATSPRPIADVLAPLAVLGTLDPESGQVVSPLLELIGTIPAAVQRDGTVKPNQALALLAELRVETLLAAIGITSERHELCSDPEAARCWLFRLVQAFQESMSLADEKLTIDGEKLLARFATLGDSFQKSSRWRFYFHLTLGMGVLRAFDVPIAGGTEDRWSPVVAEQIGFGVASPAFLGDRVTFKLGVFGSGILFRAVLDSAESDAVMLGGFAAVDIYETIQLFVAPQLVIYPAGTDTDAAAELGVSAGIQVPLAGYLERL